MNREPSTVNRQPSTVNRVGGACRRRRGFTLVEMLVVILLIAVLAGLVFRMTSMANDRASKAKKLVYMAKLQAAIEEFYAEYGQYPPVPSYPMIGQPIYYMFPDVNEPSFARMAGVVQSADEREGKKSWQAAWEAAPMYTFGLLAFLMPRYNDTDDEDYEPLLKPDGTILRGGGKASGFSENDMKNIRQWKSHHMTPDKKYAKDADQDIAFCHRAWAHLSDIVDTDYWNHDCWIDSDHWNGKSLPNATVKGYTNLCWNLKDDDVRGTIHYSSSSPYQSYDLYADHNGKKIRCHVGE